MKAFLKSFVYAWRGIVQSFNGQRNIWVMAGVAIIVTTLGVILRLEPLSLAIILLTCALVLGLEMMNTALEAWIDRQHPEKHEDVARVKDILAGAVLMVSIFAVVIGLLILGPPLLQWIRTGSLA